MPLQKTEAIVLRSINYGETSKILTLYSRSFGKISVIAKGARNIKSRFGGALEPLNYLSIVFYAKENRDLHYLNQAELHTAFEITKSDLERTYLAMAVCELLDRIEAGHEPNQLLFRLQLSTLNQINDKSNDAFYIFRAFQIHLAGVMGFRPNFNGCISCRCALSGKVLFELGSGGLICETCHTAGATDVVLFAEALDTLQKLQRIHISKLKELMISETAQRQVDNFLRSFLRYHVEGLGELKSLQFLAKIK